MHAQLQSVGRTLALDLDERQLRRPSQLQQRLERVRQANPDLLVGERLPPRRERAGPGRPRRSPRQRGRHAGPAPRRPARPLSAATACRRSSASAAARPLRNRAPRAARALGPGARATAAGPIGDVVLRLDRTRTDTALASDVGQMIVLATLLALIVGLSFAALLNRAVLLPLQQLREAIHACAPAPGETRLAWERSDELGELSGDFDAMAAQLQESHSRLQSLALKDPLTGLLNHRSFHETLQRELADAEQTNSPGGAGRARPRPLQGDQRHLRPSLRRRGAAHGQPLPARRGAPGRPGRARRRRGVRPDPARRRRRARPRGRRARPRRPRRPAPWRAAG